jgi:type IV pilus assembly protein PilO
MNVKVVKEIIKAQPKTFIVIFTLALLNSCLWAYAAAYQKPRLEDLQRNWFEKRKSATGGALLSIAADYQQGERDLKAWRARIIPKKEFARFAGSLFETAANNSLAFKGVSYRVTQYKDENLAAYLLDFNVTGKYAAVKSFIADIGRMREIMTIDNISLNNSGEKGDAVALKVQLTVYLRMEEQ